MATAAYDFISSVGDSIGGFVGNLASNIWDFFRNFGKDNSVGDGDMETEGSSGLLLDDFVLAAGSTDGTMKAPETDDGPWAGSLGVSATLFFNPANDDMLAAFNIGPVDQSDYLLG